MRTAPARHDALMSDAKRAYNRLTDEDKALIREHYVLLGAAGVRREFGITATAGAIFAFASREGLTRGGRHYHRAPNPERPVKRARTREATITRVRERGHGDLKARVTRTALHEAAHDGSGDITATLTVRPAVLASDVDGRGDLRATLSRTPAPRPAIAAKPAKPHDPRRGTHPLVDEVIEYLYVHGMGVTAIGVALGIPPHTVMRRAQECDAPFKRMLYQDRLIERCLPDLISAGLPDAHAATARLSDHHLENL
jgi:hypothetical protein